MPHERPTIGPSPDTVARALEAKPTTADEARDKVAPTQPAENAHDSSRAPHAKNDQEPTPEPNQASRPKDPMRGNIHVNLLQLILELYRSGPLENDEAELTRILNWLDKTLKEHPELRTVFRRHAVAAIARRSVDPQKYMADTDIGDQIRQHVTLRWIDFRFNPDPEKPWTSNPVLFVRHVYGEWIERGVLELAHLRHDIKLYNSYIHWIRKHTDDALPLAKITRAILVDNNLPKSALRPHVPVTRALR